MARHAHDIDTGSERLLPRSPLLRLAIPLVVVLLVGGTALTLYVTGGLRSAEQASLTSPGDPITNDLFTVELREAWITTDGGLGAQLHVSGKLVSHHDEPVSNTSVMSMIEPKLSPGGVEASSGKISLDRLPKDHRDISEVQPEMPEKVTLRWVLLEPGGDLDGDIDEIIDPSKAVITKAAKQDKVTVRITDGDYTSGFTDQTKRWFKEDDTVSRVKMPTEQR